MKLRNLIMESVNEVSTKEYIEHLENIRNDFYNRGLKAKAAKVQADIDKLIKKEEPVNKSDAYTLHMLADTPGTGTAEEFLKNNPNIDLDLLAVAIQQGTINKYELRDIVKGVALDSQVEKFMKQFVKESVNEASSDEKLYKDLLKQRARAVRKGQTTLVNSLHKEIEKLVRTTRKNKSVNKDHDTFKSDIEASRALTAKIHKVLLAYHNEPVPEKKKKLKAQLEKLKAKALVLKKKIMPEKIAKRSLLGTIMSEIKTDRKL